MTCDDCLGDIGEVYYTISTWDGNVKDICETCKDKRR